MNTRVVLAAGMLAFALTTTHAWAQASADVERAQKALKQHGHDPGPIDGVMRPQTSAALKAYQQKHGLRVTGELDAETAAKLGESPHISAPSARTGGDKRPNAVDPAQAGKTGANVGEGASYSRSNEKGQSTTK
jgi:peptidoglycan hydrolase-like protein with peptidoglycan-binding domain